MNFQYKEVGGGYLVELKYSEQRTETTPKTTPKTGAVILELIQGNPKITRESMAEYLGISVNGVKQQIKKLKEDGVLQRMGSHRSGYWKVVGGQKQGS